MAEVPMEKTVEKMPFDLYGDLEDAYDKAERNGDVEIVETLDAFGLWDDRPKVGNAFMRKVWRAVNGDAIAQADVGHAFFWKDTDQNVDKYKWLDKPLLAIYWYELAAEAGYGAAQWDLPPSTVPIKPQAILSRSGDSPATGWSRPQIRNCLARCTTLPFASDAENAASATATSPEPKRLRPKPKV